MELIPRQLRSMNTRPQQSGRTLKPANRFKQRLLKNLEICRDAIGQRTFQMIPDPFIRIQFRGISRESEGANFRMFFKPLLGSSRPVRRAAIPEQNKTFGQMSFEMFQEFDHLRPTDILLGMQSDIKIDPFVLWRYADRRDGRNLTPTASRSQDRCLPLGCPSPLDRRDQGEAALVKKYDGNSSSQGVFLYAATGTSSNSELPVHFSPELFSPASDNSIPYRLADSKYIWDGTQPLAGAVLLPRSFASSTILSNTRSSPLLAEEFRPTSRAAFHSACLADLLPILVLILFALVLYTAFATDAPNFSNTLTSLLLPALLIRPLTTQSLAGAASQVVLGFRLVSCNQININSHYVPFISWKSIIDNTAHSLEVP